MRARVSSRTAGLAVLLLGVAAFCAARALLRAPRGSAAPKAAPPSERARTVPEAVAAQFVGNHACAVCHPQEYREHVVSNHARTLRPMRPEHLPKGFPQGARFRDPETGTEYALAQAYGSFTFTARSPAGVSSRPIDFALGSGKQGMTFLSLDGPHAMRELRMSYFPARRQWFVTPGQQGEEADPVGLRHEGVRAQRCLSCHSTGLAASRLVPEERSMGVGCEACHGPGRAHVAAARSGAAPGNIQRLSQWGATRLNHLCGECHRSEREIDLQNETAVSQTERFQPYGLMKSACFQKSGDRLSCLACHNPHRNVATAPQSYDPVCRSCHAPGHAGSKLCPVSTDDGCVRCHMPSRELLPGIKMADHWIRVFPATAPGSPQPGYPRPRRSRSR